MFKLKPNPTFWAPVEIVSPGGDETTPIEIEFRHQTKSGYAAFIDQVRAGELKDIDVLRALVAGWRGAEVEFSDAALVELDENYPGAVRSILDAYREGLVGARRKN